MVGSDVPLASVVIPVFNSASTLARAVRSALAQTETAIEIIVIDDGSQDDSHAVACTLAAEDPRVRVLRMDSNGGKPRAMNHAIASARGRWIAVLDADDWYDPQRLDVLLAAGEAQGVDMVADNLHFYDGGAGVVVRTAFDPELPPRPIGAADFAASSNPRSPFDFGLLKPILRADFLRAQEIRYYEPARFGQDFYYLFDVFAAGGRGWLESRACYYWTMPFGSVSRRWTETGRGAWRYDYALIRRVNDDFIDKARRLGRAELVDMLKVRGDAFAVLESYVAAQKAVAERRFTDAAGLLLTNPKTWPMLAARARRWVVERR